MANATLAFRRGKVDAALAGTNYTALMMEIGVSAIIKSQGTVLFVIGSVRIGGSEKQMAMLAEELVRRGWRVEIFCLEGRGVLPNSLPIKEIQIHSGGWNSTLPRWLKILYLGRAQWRLIVLAARLRPDVLHAFLPLTNLIGAIAGRLTFRRLVITSHRALGTHQDRNRIWIVFDRIANRLSDFVTTNSRAVAADTISRDRLKIRKLKSIYNGIDIGPFEASAQCREAARTGIGLGPGSTVVACVGNLIAYKGHRDLIAAFAAISRDDSVKGKSMTLLLAGEDRGMGEHLARQAFELGVSDKVRFLGSRTDIPNILAAADIGVLPSHEEGFSNALLEMLAAGLPVVATDVGGNREALAGLEGCILVPPSDSVALAAAIRLVIARLPEPPEQSASRVAQIKERFPIGPMVDRYEKLYRENE